MNKLSQAKLLHFQLDGTVVPNFGIRYKLCLIRLIGTILAYHS